LRAAPPYVGEMDVRIRVRILGIPALPADGQEIELGEPTLADVKRRLTEIYPDLLSWNKVLVGFVNGKAVGRDWKSVVLNDGDSVMLVAPISGG